MYIIAVGFECDCVLESEEAKYKCIDVTSGDADLIGLEDSLGTTGF